MFRLSRFGLLLCFAPLAGATAPTVLARLPLRFEANQGQAPANVRYTGRAGAYTLQLTPAGPSLFLGSRRVDVSLVGGNRAPRIDALDPVGARTDYFVGSRNRWRTNVPSYSRVRYSSVYPGIDTVYYGNNNQLEFDFLVAPGADPKTIRMRFQGAKSVRIAESGDLLVDDMIQKRPVIYQQAPWREVSGRYVMLGKNTVGVRVGDYDRSRELVIDPVLTYASYMGGTGGDRINASKLVGNKLYLTGQTTNQDLGSTEGAYSPEFKNLTDMFVAIVDMTPGGGYPLQYMTYFGGTNVDIGLALDVDSQGFIYLTGQTSSTDFPMAGQNVQNTGAGTNIASFLVKLHPQFAGTDALWYSTYLAGDTGETIGKGIAVGPDGSAYIIGTTKAENFPVTSNAYQAVRWGPQDVFVSRIDQFGTLVYSTYIGGEGFDDGRAILLGANGLIYITASTLSDYFPMAGFSAQPFRAGAQDVILDVMDLNKEGEASLVYGTFYGGSGNEEVRGMAFDTEGNIVLTGYTLSTDLPITGDAVQTANAGNGDAFVVVLNPSIAFTPGLRYSTYFGGSGGDVGLQVAADAQDNIAIAGYTLSADLPVAGAVPQSEWGRGTDLFVTKLKRGVGGRGALEYSTYVGATATYLPTGMTAAADGSLIVVGYGGSGMPVTEDARQGIFFGGSADGFILVLK
jgi:hypothetical protein